MVRGIEINEVTGFGVAARELQWGPRWFAG